mgnify:CR=1 FL=1
MRRTKFRRQDLSSLLEREAGSGNGALAVVCAGGELCVCDAAPTVHYFGPSHFPFVVVVVVIWVSIDCGYPSSFIFCVASLFHRVWYPIAVCCASLLPAPPLRLSSSSSLLFILWRHYFLTPHILLALSVPKDDSTTISQKNTDIKKCYQIVSRPIRWQHARRWAPARWPSTPQSSCTLRLSLCGHNLKMRLAVAALDPPLPRAEPICRTSTSRSRTLTSFQMTWSYSFRMAARCFSPV